MIALIQRVTEAKVVVNDKNIGEIQQGVLAFIGIEKNDSEEQVTRLLDKILSYRIFADELQFGRDVKILVSKDIHISSRSLMLGREVRSHCWMFNVFFNQKFDEDQFIDGSVEDIVKGDYTYAFITLRDWKDIHEKHNVEHLLKQYDQKVDNKTQLIMLKKN